MRSGCSPLQGPRRAVGLRAVDIAGRVGTGRVRVGISQVAVNQVGADGEADCAARADVLAPQ